MVVTHLFEKKSSNSYWNYFLQNALSQMPLKVAIAIRYLRRRNVRSLLDRTALASQIQSQIWLLILPKESVNCTLTCSHVLRFCMHIHHHSLTAILAEILSGPDTQWASTRTEDTCRVTLEAKSGQEQENVPPLGWIFYSCTCIQSKGRKIKHGRVVRAHRIRQNC